MTDTNQKLREALQAYQDANEMSPYGDYSKIEWESGAGPVNPSWGGGDCKKHGRWYGRCYSCSDEWDNLRKSADRDAYTARENALNAAKQMARQALALPTAAPVGDLPELPEPAEYFVFAGLDWHRATAAYFNSCSGEKLVLYTADQMRAYARAALSAGDAVDAQRYRWLRDQCNHKGTEGSRIASREYGMDWDTAIDKAMRKGPL